MVELMVGQKAAWLAEKTVVLWAGWMVDSMVSQKVGPKAGVMVAEKVGSKVPWRVAQKAHSKDILLADLTGKYWEKSMVELWDYLKADVKVDQRADGMVPLMVALMAQNLECLMAESMVD